MNNMASPAGTLPKRPLSVEGVQRGTSGTEPTQSGRPERPFARPRTTSAKKHQVFEKLQLPLLLLAGLLGGLLAQTLALGLLMLAIYLVTVIIKRIPSRTSFMLALLMFLAISILLLFKPDPQLNRNFATYGFILLMIGVATLGREARMPRRQRRLRR